jgi:hypothetical protein
MFDEGDRALVRHMGIHLDEMDLPDELVVSVVKGTLLSIDAYVGNRKYRMKSVTLLISDPKMREAFVQAFNKTSVEPASGPILLLSADFDDYEMSYDEGWFLVPPEDNPWTQIDSFECSEDPLEANNPTLADPSDIGLIAALLPGSEDNNLFTCPECDMSSQGASILQCEFCLKWYHFS